MGWYDSFRGNAAGINMNGVGDDAGLGAKAFGDAFVSIGKNMTDAKKNEEALKVQEVQMRADEAKIAAEDAKTTLYGTQNTAALDTIDETKKTRETKKLDDAFSNSYRSVEGAENLKLFKDNYRTGDGYGNISDDAVKAADIHFQSKFNDEAKNVAVSKGYKDFTTFAKENEQLVKMADGATMTQIDKLFADKDMSAAKLTAQENSTKNQIAMLNKEQEISNLTAAKNKAEIKAEKEQGNLDDAKFSKYIRDREAMEFDKEGNKVLSETTKLGTDFKNTQARTYVKQGADWNTAYDLASKDWTVAEAEQKKAALMKTNPLNVKTEAKPQVQNASGSSDFLGIMMP